jgi:hypothetical protein
MVRDELQEARLEARVEATLFVLVDTVRSRVHEGWYPRLEDYVYVALTNGIAFSPTDAMPLTRWAKASMAMESVISVAAILLVAARAVNVLG